MKKTLIPKTKEEILKILDEKVLALRDIRFGVAGSKGKNVKETSMIRKEVARLNTALTSLSNISK